MDQDQKQGGGWGVVCRVCVGPLGLPSALACCRSARMVASHLAGWCSQEERVAGPNPDSGRRVWTGFRNSLSVSNYKIYLLR